MKKGWVRLSLFCWHNRCSPRGGWGVVSIKVYGGKFPYQLPHVSQGSSLTVWEAIPSGQDLSKVNF